MPGLGADVELGHRAGAAVDGQPQVMCVVEPLAGDVFPRKSWAQTVPRGRAGPPVGTRLVEHTPVDGELLDEAPGTCVARRADPTRHHRRRVRRQPGSVRPDHTLRPAARSLACPGP
jgi:hypothetical protein